MACEGCGGVRCFDDMIRYRGLVFCEKKCAKKWAVDNNEKDRRARIMTALFGSRRGDIIV